MAGMFQITQCVKPLIGCDKSFNVIARVSAFGDRFLNNVTILATTIHIVKSTLKGVKEWSRKKRKDRAADTKNKIFETAVTLIKSKGYKNVTVSEICQAAGLAKGSFYVHYDSKEDIVRESYYADMGTYICTHYNEFISSNPRA